MKKTAILIGLAGLIAIAGCNSKKLHCSIKNINRDWHLSIQAYNFKEFSFAETVDKVKSLSLHNIEGYESQSISKEKPQIKTSHLMSLQTMSEVKNLLAKGGLKLRTFYISGLGNSADECRKSFEFAKAMGVEVIVSEPNAKQLDIAEPLCEEYKIKLAIHNNPKRPVGDIIYWHPDSVLAVCKDRSEWIGACVDTGHWTRSGLDTVEMLKKMQGRIITIHLKDVSEFGRYDARDVPWGTGQSNVKGILNELARQHFKGIITIEYENNSENLIPEIARCIKFFDKTAAQLGYERQ